MIITGILIWLYLILGKLSGVLIALLIIYSILFIIVTINYASIADIYDRESTEFIEAKNAFNKLLNQWKSVTIAILLIITYPSIDNLKLIIGGAVAIEVIQNTEGLDKLPQNIVNAVNAFLEGIK